MAKGDSLLPLMGMVLVQLGFAGMNILSKIVIDSGMSPLVLVTYRQMFATLAIGPVAYLMERNARQKITLSILFQIFLCSLFGATMNQICYYLGLKNTTPTITCALNNLLPAVTFILAVPFRLESVGIRKRQGQAKVAGTILCVGGAMLLSFYHGNVINIGESSIHWKYVEGITKHHSIHKPNFVLGSALVLGSCTAWAIWFIVQAKMTEFNALYTTSALMCFMASIESGIIGLCFEHNIAAWSLRSNIRLITSLYAAIVSSAMSFCIMSWCIQMKGPLYVSVFSPLLLVIVTVLTWALLREKLYVGTAIGSVLIVCGLYAVLWGKNKELKEKNCVKEAEKNDKLEDLELQAEAHGVAEK